MDRFIEHKRNFYDLDWNVMKGVGIKYPADENCTIQRPGNLDTLLEYAKSFQRDLFMSEWIFIL